MSETLYQSIRRLAGGRCEYCKVPDGITRMLYVLDHVIASQHGGLTESSNLAFCCPQCNLHKGPNIAGIDPETGQLARLFHPRKDLWEMHFHYRGTTLVGTSDVARTTIAVLAINLPLRVVTRQSLADAGIF